MWNDLLGTRHRPGGEGEWEICRRALKFTKVDRYFQKIFEKSKKWLSACGKEITHQRTITFIDGIIDWKQSLSPPPNREGVKIQSKCNVLLISPRRALDTLVGECMAVVALVTCTTSVSVSSTGGGGDTRAGLRHFHRRVVLFGVLGVEGEEGIEMMRWTIVI